MIDGTINDGKTKAGESGELAKIMGEATSKVIVESPSHIFTMLKDDISGKYR